MHENISINKKIAHYHKDVDGWDKDVIFAGKSSSILLSVQNNNAINQKRKPSNKIIKHSSKLFRTRVQGKGIIL